MIIKGQARSRAKQLASHLLRTDQNEIVSTFECRGTLAQDVEGALIEMEARGKMARAQRPLYHASISPEATMPLSDSQVRQAADLLEKRLGLHGLPRVIVLHRKNEREHVHVVWSRVSAETGTAVHMSWNYRVHEQTARELELRFGHRSIPSSTGGRKRGGRRASQDYEARQSKRSGIGVNSISSELTALWEMSRTGSEFKRRLEEAGYVLVRGDRRVYVVVDRAGNTHSLARRISGTDTKAVRNKLRDIPLSELPSVQQGRCHVRNLPAPRPARTGRKFKRASQEITSLSALDSTLPRATAFRARKSLREMVALEAPQTNALNALRPMVIALPLRTYRAARAALLSDFASRIAQAIRFLPRDEVDAALERLSEERDAAILRLDETNRTARPRHASGRVRRRRYRYRRLLNIGLR